MKDREYIIIGDVHGCYDELCQLLDKTHYDPTHHTLICVGDLINKGPHSRKCYELLSQCPSSVVLMGNHERKFAKAYQSRSVSKSSAFSKMVQNWSPAFTREVATWCAHLPYSFATKDFLVVHAGFDPLKGFGNSTPEDYTEIRNINRTQQQHPWHSLYKGERMIFYGHWARQGVHITRNTFCLDSSCVYGGALSAVMWPQMKFYQVKAKRVYQRPSKPTTKCQKERQTQGK